jgi:hypothetical protein
MICHILMDFFLKVDADGAVSANDFVGADAGAGGDVPSRVGNADVGGIVADDVMRALDGGGDEAVEERSLGWRELGNVPRGCG